MNYLTIIILTLKLLPKMDYNSKIGAQHYSYFSLFDIRCIVHRKINISLN